LLKRIVIAGLACTVLAKPAVLDDLATATLVAHSILAPGVQTRLMLATAVRRPITHGIRLIEQEIKTLVENLIAGNAQRFGLTAIS
jgi:LysR family nitrogen assimilation transcriptional regulator